MTKLSSNKLAWCVNGTYLTIHNHNRKPLRILMSSLDAYGHFNAILGLGEKLVSRGHHVYYANRSGYRSMVEASGLKFIPIENYDPTMGNFQANQVILKYIDNYAKQMEKSSLNRLTDWSLNDLVNNLEYFSEMKRMEKVLEIIIDKMKPDLVIGDFTFALPLFIKSTIPCIPLLSTNPLPLYGERGPPIASGYSVKGPKDVWSKYRKAEKLSMIGLQLYLRPWWWRKCLSPPESSKLRSFAKYFGIYVYPSCLDYDSDLGHPPSNWVRMDMCIRQSQSEFQLPDCLNQMPGKLIYLSMGSLGSVNLKLMRRLVTTLSSCPHRFIVSKGARGDQLELTDNMWGDNFVNQLAILPKVDLVITNGGSNTIIESLSAGKPMIVLPLFYDQLDNAQRIDEKGLGRRLDPFNYKEGELLETIEDLLENRSIRDKVEQVAREMRKSVEQNKVCELIESLAFHVKFGGPVDAELKQILPHFNKVCNKSNYKLDQ
ncbi:uncharacterized UDP-glucosyltransferase YjiC-like [Tetranychus urticae]|uniref:UDP-glycosyltransferase 204C1 n=1 Tax=Tetranychus urticae TaxID=32264 RepID=T1KI17_TETUR|nr:uncharacterized UDP-glucosyltransferase YjiC-like [Tetranychus urticae]AHX56909.1 UDP-glycosyltransferase 204C1 [Tetranychus urticae]